MMNNTVSLSFMGSTPNKPSITSLVAVIGFEFLNCFCDRSIRPLSKIDAIMRATDDAGSSAEWVRSLIQHCSTGDENQSTTLIDLLVKANQPCEVVKFLIEETNVTESMKRKLIIVQNQMGAPNKQTNRHSQKSVVPKKSFEKFYSECIQDPNLKVCKQMISANKLEQDYINMTYLHRKIDAKTKEMKTEGTALSEKISSINKWCESSLASLEDPFLTVSMEGKILRCNTACYRTFGFNDTDILSGKVTIENILPTLDINKELATLQGSSVSDDDSNMIRKEGKAINKLGKELHVVFSIAYKSAYPKSENEHTLIPVADIWIHDQEGIIEDLELRESLLKDLVFMTSVFEEIKNLGGELEEEAGELDNLMKRFTRLARPLVSIEIKGIEMKENINASK